MRIMKNILSLTLAAFIVLAAFPAFAQSAEEDAILEAKKAIVEVLVYTDDEKKPSRIGAGFVINNDVIVTETELVTDETKGKVSKIEVLYYKDLPLEAQLVSCSKNMDWAILKTDSKMSFQGLTLGAPSDFKPGPEVYALGISKEMKQKDDLYDFSLDDVTVSVGSLLRKTTVDNNGKVDVLEHGALIDEYNTGGPLIYFDGLNIFVVGINSYKLSNIGESFNNRSVNINVVLEVLDILTPLAPTTHIETTTEPILIPPTPLNPFRIIAGAVVAVIIVVLIITFINMSKKNKNRK